jgi:glucose-6-phosphate-specific signal transduction histidine kinase
MAMSGASLIACFLLVFVALPSAVTLLVPRRWFPVWVGLIALVLLWLWNDELDAPGAVFAYFSILITSFLNGIVVVTRVIKIAFDYDRE